MESGAEVESLHKTIYQGEGTEISLMDKLPEKENRQEKEKLQKVKDRLNHAIEVCRKKINDATQSLEDAKTKVYKN